MIRGSMGNYSLECDVCGEEVTGFDSFEDALHFKKDPVNAWTSRRVDGDWYDRCPACEGWRP